LLCPCTEYTETRTITSYNQKKPDYYLQSYRNREIPGYNLGDEEVRWKILSSYNEYDPQDTDFSNWYESRRSVIPYPPGTDRDDNLDIERQNSFRKNILDIDSNYQENSGSSRPNIFISAKNGSPVYVYAPGKVKNTTPRYVSYEKPVENASLDNYGRYNQPSLHYPEYSTIRNRDNDSRAFENLKLSPKRVTFASPLPEEDENSHLSEKAWIPHPPEKDSPNRSFTTYRNSFDPTFRQEEVGFGQD